MTEKRAKAVLTLFVRGFTVEWLSTQYVEPRADIMDVLRWGLLRARATRDHRRQPTWTEYATGLILAPKESPHAR